MSLARVREQIRAGAFTESRIGSERAFHALWREEIAESGDWVNQAVLGGAFADRFAWVFLAGYQPAIRHTFAGTPFSDWASYAVSEDRTGKLAPVTWTRQGEDFVLDGYKTWVAGVENMRHLIVKAGRGADARYFVIDRDSPGLHLTTKPEGFLADMTEGIAHLQSVRLTADNGLDASEVKRFGSRERLYIYAAFCGLVAGKCADADVVEQCWKLVQRVAPLLDAPEDIAAVKSFDRSIQSLRETAQPFMRNVVGWDEDQRLIGTWY